MAINGLGLSTNNISAQLASKLDVAGGKILQIVRATDATDRSTTSTSYVDASISVTITPQKSDSAILVIWSALADRTGANESSMFRISDASNNALSGAEAMESYENSTGTLRTALTIIGYSTPATTSATTYKGRLRSNNASVTTAVLNSRITGQLYAIEVSA